MKKRYLRKWMTGLLCAVLILTNALSTGIQASAAGPGTDELVVNEKLDGDDNEIQNAIEEDETVNDVTGVKDDSDIEDEEEQEEKDIQDETDSDNSDDEIENSEEGLKDEKADKVEEAEKNIENDLLPASAENELMLMADLNGGVSGSFGDTNWMISANGKLTVEGTGEAGNTNLLAGSLYRTLPWYEYRDSITSAEIRVTGMKDASYLFYGCSNLVSVDLREFDTSNVIKMNSMFLECRSLTDIEWGDNFSTSNVVYMDHMFSGCHNLDKLELNHFNTSNVIDMDSMFSYCENLNNLDLSKFDTGNVTNMRYMFSYCSALSSLDLGNFITSNVTDMSSMFSGCHALSSLNLESFDTSNVINMTSMFTSCRSLEVLDLSNFDVGNCKNIESAGSFRFLYDCYNLTTIYTPCNLTQSVELPVLSIAIWYRSDGTTVTELPQNLSYSIILGKDYIPREGSMDNDSKNINSLIAAKILSYKGNYPEGYKWNETFNNGQVSGSQCYGFALLMADRVFGSCPAVLRKAKDGELSNGWTCYIVNSSNCNSLVVEPGDIIDAASTGAQHTVMVRDVSDDGILSFVQCNLGTNCKVYWDEGYNYTKSNNTLSAIYNYSIKYNSNYVVRLWKPSKEAKYAAVGMEVPDGDPGCSNPDVQGNVSTRSVLASGIVDEISIYFDWVVFSSGELVVDGNTGNFSSGQDVIPWSDYKVSIISAKIDVTGMTSAYKMFDGYNNLKEVDLSGFDTSQVTNMSYMFYGCTSLESLDLSGFDTSQVTDMSYMFYGCTGLESLNLSSFNVAAVTDWRGFLSQSTSLRQINTPKNLSASVELPVKTGESWYLPDGSKITELPKNSSVSVLITKRGNSENSGGSNTESSHAGSSWQTSDRIDISGGTDAGTVVNVETWKPTTPDEKKRYACMGKETVQYTLAKNNAYRFIIENAMQGPLCFDSFEAVLGDYVIGRTYNIYPYPSKVYSMNEEVEFTIKIPDAIYEPDRTYKMICVTKDGLPIIYNDLDKNPETITVRTNKFYAYALIYK